MRRIGIPAHVVAFRRPSAASHSSMLNTRNLVELSRTAFSTVQPETDNGPTRLHRRERGGGLCNHICVRLALHITIPTNCATRACAWISVPAFGEWDFSDIGRRSESTCAVTRRTNEIKLVSLQAQGSQRNE